MFFPSQGIATPADVAAGSSSLAAFALKAEQLLFSATGLDLTITTDQALAKQFTGTRFIVTRVIGKLESGAFGTACLGGIYTAASKGGSALVAATQTWAGLTGAGKATLATLAAVAGTDTSSAATLYFALTTGNTGALAASMYVYGVVVD